MNIMRFWLNKKITKTHKHILLLQYWLSFQVKIRRFQIDHVWKHSEVQSSHSTEKRKRTSI